MNRHQSPALFAGLIAVSVLAAPTSQVLASEDSEFNQPGNYLIADQFNNRVIEVDANGKIIWHFGLGPADFSPDSIIGVNDAQRVGKLTLMAGTGTPGAQPQAPNCSNPAALSGQSCDFSEPGGPHCLAIPDVLESREPVSTSSMPRCKAPGCPGPRTHHRSGEPADY